VKNTKGTVPFVYETALILVQKITKTALFLVRFCNFGQDGSDVSL